MSEVVYRSRATVERVEGTFRLAHLPAEPAPIPFGVHDEVAAHYGRAEGSYPPHATTLDYVVAATAG